MFRVPRDHDGKGIVCPSCRRILRIPSAGDAPTPLIVPLRQTAAEETLADEAAHGVRKKHRSRKSDRAENLEWERNYRPSKRGEKNQMRLMLFGGGTLFALIVAGVIVALHGGKPTPKIEQIPEAPPKTAEGPKSDQPPAARSDTALAAEAGPMARKFLEATRVEEILPLVRNPEIVEPHIRKCYPDGKIPPAGLSQFNTRGSGELRGSIVAYTVRTRDQDEKPMAFVDGPQGLKIDWESWVGWSEISWKEFLATKSTTGRVFRLSLAPIDYYNFDFKDDLKWQSYRLESPDHETSIYGYVEKGSLLDKQIRPNGDDKSVLLMLSLKFPEKGMSPNQVLIDRQVAEGWVEENAKP
ncbi:MAG: hypothetical protein ABIT37_13190 [Luteolibacter sp.]